MENHTGAEMEEIVLNMLASLNIPLDDMRGQSYDNAANMSGQYSGLQSRIKSHNQLAEFIPCSAHSLNLVGTHAANSCLQATKLFMFIQELYVFFSASTSRWAIIETLIKNSDSKQKLLPKRLNTTRWSAKWHASRALIVNYWEFHAALEKIAENPQEKPECRAVAEGLCNYFDRIEIAILLVVWNDILERFNAASKTMQSTSADLGMVCNLYKSLRDYVQSLRERYDHYEQKGMELIKSEVANYEVDTKRRRTRKRMPDESKDTNSDTSSRFDGRQDMIVNTFFVVIDNITQELQNRSTIYFDQNAIFGVFYNLYKLNDEEVRQQAYALVNKYSSDLTPELGEELIHFKTFVKEAAAEAIDESTKDHHLPGNFLKFIRQKQLTTLFPNIDTALKILLCMMTTNASGERSFSILKRVKNYLRNSTTDTRLSSLVGFAANSELLNDLNFDNVIDEFSSLKARKLDL